MYMDRRDVILVSYVFIVLYIVGVLKGVVRCFISVGVLGEYSKVKN